MMADLLWWLAALAALAAILFIAIAVASSLPGDGS